MLQRYSTRILAGTHSPICSCMTPSFIIAATPTDSKCCWKKHPKKVWFPSLFQLCTQALECPTTNNQGSRPVGCILQIPENTPVLWMNLHHVSFFCSFCFLFFCSCLFLVIYIPTPHPFSTMSIQVNGITCYKSGRHQHHALYLSECMFSVICCGGPHLKNDCVVYSLRASWTMEWGFSWYHWFGNLHSLLGTHENHASVCLSQARDHSSFEL